MTALVLAAEWLSRGDQPQTPCFGVVAEMAQQVALLVRTGQMDPCAAPGDLRLVPRPKG